MYRELVLNGESLIQLLKRAEEARTLYMSDRTESNLKALDAIIENISDEWLHIETAAESDPLFRQHITRTAVIMRQCVEQLRDFRENADEEINEVFNARHMAKDCSAVVLRARDEIGFLISVLKRLAC
jgi:hypothetical protein